MRYDRRYNRVLSIITSPDVPKLPNGGPALCHWDQRRAMLAGGFLYLLSDAVFDMSKKRKTLVWRQQGNKRK
jgi:hypothetical protein